MNRPAYLPSLLDRLQDDAPKQRSERPDAYAPDEHGMRRIIQRDLGLLFNAMNLLSAAEEERYPEVAASVVNYGVPQLSGTYVSEFSWEALEQRIRMAITCFEPRLIPDSVRLRPIKDADPGRHNRLMFEIDCLMQWLPYPLEFRVQSLYDLETNKVALDLAGSRG
ncbi:MAG: type VI secretion system baseplate subunit TssE [Cupriavidus sp.]|nr:type VI secretion system baseplate subunit TssE [Cupriavidus sp.]